MGDMNFGIVWIDNPFKDIDERTGEKYPYRTLGVSNLCLKGDIRNELMFYDCDSKTISEWDFGLILSKFENDVFLVETTKGFHFVSLTLNMSNESPLKKVVDLSSELNEDFGWRADIVDYLTLRIAPKYHNINGVKIHKPKPKFYTMVKYPKKGSICSLEHLKVYKNLGLPDKVVQLYLKRCNIIDYKTKFFYYFSTN